MKANLLQKFKKQIGIHPVYGPFCKTSDPGIIEVLGYAGFDFIILDMEHGPNNLETIQHLIRAAEIAEIISIVRVSAGDYEMISKVLDVGADGVQVPQVSTAQDVERAMQSAKFAPLGERGVCRYVRAARYSSTEKNDYFHQANDALLIIQLEGKQALQNLDEILKVKGPDIVFIGPYDLSQSLGVTGDIEHPLVIEKTKEIVKACIDQGIAVGNFTESPTQTGFWTQQGLRYMSFSVDMGIMYNASRDLVADLRRESKSGT
jgi:4-hydroxy-2-oxoheptanedioate aldolase